MADSGAIIGGLLEGFSGGFDRGLNFGAIFEQNQTRREQRGKNNDRLNAVEGFQAFLKIKNDTVAGKMRSGLFERAGFAFKMPELGKFLAGLSDKELEKVMANGDEINREFPELGATMIDLTIRTKGAEGLLDLLKTARKRRQKREELEFAGAPVSSQSNRPILEETVPAGPRQFRPIVQDPGIIQPTPQGGAARGSLPNVRRSFLERAVLARRKIFQELTLKRNKIGVEGGHGKLVQKRVDQAERAMIRAENELEKLGGGKTEGTLEQSRRAFLQGRASREQLALIRQDESKFVKDYVESFGALVGPRKTQELRKQGEVIFEIERLKSNPLPKNITTTSAAVQYLVRNLKFEEDRAKEIVKQIMGNERANPQ